MAEEIKKKKGFFRKNGWVILLVLATGGVVATSFYDKDHEDMIEVTVDKGSEEERIQKIIRQLLSLYMIKILKL